MGRAQKLKQARKWEQIVKEALRLEAQQAKKPCDSCAFVDPEAFMADHAMAHKLRSCLNEAGHQFYCHEGLPTETRLDGSPGAYIPPKTPEGRVDASQLTRCGGFLRWRLKYLDADLPTKLKAVDALQRHMLRRYLEGDYPLSRTLRDAAQGNMALAVKLLQQALNDESMGILWDKEDSP